ncbi:MAG: isoquinoline 1-oxidoreductase subunit beta IorB, molybdoprotein [Herbaspirillum sp.]|jgi:nicotinate dehydrogenase subunit B|nr:isoquinoline 1-oxidoreductase subunit beta IorB, molybdoprotein [Herbaspirillum sp.]
MKNNRQTDAATDVLDRPSRRGFLQAGGAIVVSFAFPMLASAQTSTPKNKLALYTGLDSWLAIGENGDVTVYCGKVELGTGVTTSLSQAVAEELTFPVSRITMIMGDTAICPDQGTTTGSKTTALGSPPLRQAAAEARAMLAELGAARLGVTPAEVTVHDGLVFVSAAPQKRLNFAELMGGKRFNRKISAHPKLKAIADYTIVGQPVPRVDLPAKATASFEYVQNIRLPGMLHGRVVRPAAIGAKLVRVDEDSIKKLPGVRVVTRGDFVGVVAPREEIAIAAARQLKVEWKMPANAGESVDTHKELRTYPSKIENVAAAGNVDTALPKAAKVFKATYLTPFQMHGSIGPSCSVADVRGDSARVWCGTQHGFGLIGAVAGTIGIPADKVRVSWTEASGCYGHNGADDSAVDAALLSQAVGKPVRVQWMRQDEHGWEPKGPAMAIDIAAGVDASGNIQSWDFINITASHSSRPRGHSGNTLGGVFTGHAPDFEMSNGGRNADITYVVPDKRIRIRYHNSSPLRASALRGLSGYPHTFANETFMDELATNAHADPVAFRLRYLKDERARAVITTVAKTAQWDARPSAGKIDSSANLVRGRGIAFCQYENENAYAAVVAHVEIDRSTGKTRVTHMYAAFDCGLVVNPDGARNQVEGCLVQGMSRALFEEVSFNRGGVTSTDWSSYPIARFEDIPEVVQVELINRLDKPSVGAGEASTCPVAAAIGNAIFDATGARLRQYPFSPDRLKTALNNKPSNGDSA